MTMTRSHKILFSLSLLSALLFIAHAHDHASEQHIECKHDTLEFNPEVADVEEDFLATQTRLLKSVSVSISNKGSSSSSSSSSSTTVSTSPSGSSSPSIPTTSPGQGTNSPNSAPTNTGIPTPPPTPTPTSTPAFPNIRIYPHFDSINVGTEEFKTYIKEELLPPVISILQRALRLKYPLLTPMRLTQKTLCGIPTPEVISSTGAGLEVDFVLLFSSKLDTSSSWVASASSCLVSSGVRRPLVANIVLNTNAIRPTTVTLNPLGHEYNMYVLMHEILHGLGFSKNFFNNYVDAEGNLLKNHVKKISLAGNDRTVLDLHPLTDRLRKFYGCSSLPGAFMEDDGGSGTSGSHWERRFFPFDLLSSGAIHGRRFTEFTLAFLEGTGWYDPDYSFAEPFHFGQGLGCDFIYGNCTTMASDLGKYEEHCIGTGRGCTDVGHSGGFCKTDVCSDGCRFVVPQREYNCENPDGVYYTAFASKQVYGRGLGSKCFSGNLTTSSKTVKKTTYCFKFNCVGEGSSTVLEVLFGTAKLICEKAGPLTVSGYKGAVDCPDPLKFCSTIGKPYCPRGCSGRGKCVDHKCVCDRGFQGVDCAFRDL